MFSATAIGLIVALSTGTWVYTQTLRRTGGNNKSSIITGAVAAGIAFVMIVTLVWTIDSMLADK